MGLSKKTTTNFKYSGTDEQRFIKKVIRMLYDCDETDIDFKDGNRRNLTRDNVRIIIK